MAKDEKQEVFVEPEFDERDFLYSEKERAKTTIVVFLIAALLGLLSGYFFVLGLWYIGVLIFFGIMIYLKKVLQFLHLQMPQRGSHVFIMVMVFFLTWLIFWTIFLNPPINAVAGPEVTGLQAYNNNTSTWNTFGESGGFYHYSIPYNNYTVHMRVYVSYITTIQNVSVSYSQGGGSPVLLPGHYSSLYLYFNKTVTPTTYEFTFTVLVHSSYYTTSMDVIFNQIS